ncbi:MAG: peptidoglycan DD-metalloendopeptidase family protein [Chitinophagaceae bacterium]
MQSQPVIQLLRKYAPTFHPVVAFSPATDRLRLMNFTAANKTLTEDIYSNLSSFSEYIGTLLKSNHYKYGIGGYDEQRVIYGAIQHFDTPAEPRRIHLGIDIWGPVDTPVFAFMGGSIHSFAFNKNNGDYGATLVLLHQLDGFAFYTLYGHISMKDIENLSGAQYLNRGQTIGHFGPPEENGGWPPHLHFQVIIDMELKEGDYPGVCKLSERDKYLHNCPDPDFILQMMQYAGK